MEKLIEENLGQFFKLRVSTLIDLNRAAEKGLSREPGALRQEGMEIVGSKHQPPAPDEVVRELERMCDYVNEHWSASPVHLASYVMWRLNWIHPFRDGNGRTSRAASYLVLCVRLGRLLPGTKTVPQRIKDDMAPYYKALEAADAAWSEGRLDLSAMEALLGRHLLDQVREAALGDRGRASSPQRDSKPQLSQPGGPRPVATPLPEADGKKADGAPVARGMGSGGWLTLGGTLLAAIIAGVLGMWQGRFSHPEPVAPAASPPRETAADRHDAGADAGTGTDAGTIDPVDL